MAIRTQCRNNSWNLRQLEQFEGPPISYPTRLPICQWKKLSCSCAAAACAAAACATAATCCRRAACATAATTVGRSVSLYGDRIQRSACRVQHRLLYYRTRSHVLLRRRSNQLPDSKSEPKISRSKISPLHVTERITIDPSAIYIWCTYILSERTHLVYIYHFIIYHQFHDKAFLKHFEQSYTLLTTPPRYSHAYPFLLLLVLADLRVGAFRYRC